jgi:hypothetical protein
MSQYDKHFFVNPLIESDTSSYKHRIVIQGSKTGFDGLMKNYWLRWNCITEPNSMGNPHTHNFDEIMHFFGADANDISDFQAVIEFVIGKERETYTFTKPFIVYIPAGLLHAPIKIKVVKKPIIFLNIASCAEYEQTDYSEDGQPKKSSIIKLKQWQ